MLGEPDGCKLKYGPALVDTTWGGGWGVLEDETSNELALVGSLDGAGMLRDREIGTAVTTGEFCDSITHEIERVLISGDGTHNFPWITSFSKVRGSRVDERGPDSSFASVSRTFSGNSPLLQLVTDAPLLGDRRDTGDDGARRLRGIIRGAGRPFDVPSPEEGTSGLYTEIVGGTAPLRIAKETVALVVSRLCPFNEAAAVVAGIENDVAETWSEADWAEGSDATFQEKAVPRERLGLAEVGERENGVLDGAGKRD